MIAAQARERAQAWNTTEGRCLGRRRWPLCLSALLLLLAFCTSSPRAAAQGGLRALDAVWLTPRLDRARDQLLLASHGGYGLLEHVADTGALHHRTSAGLALALASRHGVALELRLDGRWDHHRVRGGDDSLVGEPRLFLRYGRSFAARLRGGLELGAWVPGANAPDLAFDATTLDLLALCELSLSARLALSLALGGRLDRSAESVDTPRISRSDWLSLGVSSHHALLTRAAITWTLGVTRLAAELSADSLLGRAAPRLGESPLRAALVARRQLDAEGRLELWAMLALLASARPTVTRQDRYLPFEPRAALAFGLRLALSPARPAPRAPTTTKPSSDARAPIPPATTALAELTVQVVNPAGEPLPDVRIALDNGEEQLTGDAGRAHFQRLAEGERKVSATAIGFEGQELRFTLSARHANQLRIALAPAPELGVLRVLIRSAESGQPLAAELVVRPLPPRAQRALLLATDASGTSESKLLPARYRVTVRARGFVAQTRVIELERDTVTLFHVDLVPEPRRRR